MSYSSPCFTYCEVNFSAMNKISKSGGKQQIGQLIEKEGDFPDIATLQSLSNASHSNWNSLKLKPLIPARSRGFGVPHLSVHLPQRVFMFKIGLFVSIAIGGSGKV